MNFYTPAGKDIEKACQGIYPLQNTYIRKVKVLRAPKFDVNKVSPTPSLLRIVLRLTTDCMAAAEPQRRCLTQQS